jgi:multicomponent Na+:H+ antiporter subunit E
MSRRCALDPRLPLRPGFVTYPIHIPQPSVRNLFCALSSLLPGTLLTGLDESGSLVVHCLDVEQPVIEQMAVEQRILIREFCSSAKADRHLVARAAVQRSGYCHFCNWPLRLGSVPHAGRRLRDARAVGLLGLADGCLGSTEPCFSRWRWSC